MLLDPRKIIQKNTGVQKRCPLGPSRPLQQNAKVPLRRRVFFLKIWPCKRLCSCYCKFTYVLKFSLNQPTLFIGSLDCKTRFGDPRKIIQKNTGVQKRCSLGPSTAKHDSGMKAVGQLRCTCMYMYWGSCWTAGIHAYKIMKLFASWGVHVMWKLLYSWGSTHTHSSEAVHACTVSTWAGKAFSSHNQLHAPFLERGIVAASRLIK